MSGIAFFFCWSLVVHHQLNTISQFFLSLFFSAQQSWIMSQQGAETFSSVPRIMHEFASSQRGSRQMLPARVQLPPWFGSILHCHPPLINPLRPPFADRMSDCLSKGRSCWGGEGGAGGGAVGRGGGSQQMQQQEVKVEERGGPFSLHYSFSVRLSQL